jgi:putative hydrolase of HD superfamily
MEFSLPARLGQQIAFVVEIDRLKQVLRKTRLMDGSRNENSAEHSWHLALMAIVLAEHAAEPIDLLRVLAMLLVHDLVEIDAGDTFAFDAEANLSRVEREQVAAERIFGMLPHDQGPPLRALWEEFEHGATPDARFAVALDRLEPLLCNHRNDGGTWREHHVARSAVLRRMAPIYHGAPPLWPFVEQVIEAADRAGALGEERESV